MRPQPSRLVFALSLTLVAAAAGALPAAAQAPVPLREGDQVRSRALGVQGQVRRIDAQVIVLLPGAGQADSLVLPRAELRDLEVSRGQRRNTGKGIAMGVGGLGLGLALLSAATWEPCSGWLCFGPSSAGEAAMWGFAAGAIGGAVVGGAIGALTRTPRWERAELTATGFLGPRQDGRVAVGFRLRL